MRTRPASAAHLAVPCMLLVAAWGRPPAVNAQATSAPSPLVWAIGPGYMDIAERGWVGIGVPGANGLGATGFVGYRLAPAWELGVHGGYWSRNGLLERDLYSATIMARRRIFASGRGLASAGMGGVRYTLTDPDEATLTSTSAALQLSVGYVLPIASGLALVPSAGMTWTMLGSASEDGGFPPIEPRILTVAITIGSP